MKKTLLTRGLTSVALTAVLAVSALAGPAGAAVPALTADTPNSGLSEAEQARIIGENGASMGQGMQRLSISGDAQVPAPNEGGAVPAAGAPQQGLDSGAANPQAADPEAVDPEAAEGLGGNWRPAGIQGMDVSSHQGNVDWNRAWAQGSRFAYAKATEGTGYKNPNFGQQYGGSYGVGMVRGAYHFALPNVSSAVEQANYFVNNGGGWSADGRTLPPLLDIEYNPYTSLGNTCYNMSQTQMVNWIKAFSNQVKARTGRAPMIYTTTDWWSYCTGNSAAFGENPLHIANYNEVGAGPLPASWGFYSLWQYSSTGPFVGDSNVWNGNAAGLTAFARDNPAAAPAVPQGPFRDVPASRAFAKEITWLKNAKITTGYADGTFRPLDSVSREAMAAFLYRIKGSPAYAPPAASKFRDIGGSEFYKEINWLAAKGVATGWNGNTFGPKLDINRDAMAAFLYRLAGKPAYNAPKVSPFRDVAVSNQYYKEISWLNSTGISTGWTDGTFRPYEPIKRDAMAAFLYRYDAKF
ncbi:GH25 family lysozyme [Arthrobacter sp. NPDC097144]|uniref:GH25 family lysozyme n=1 Tax=Arthrobacter sp. NPDC097144 TaxID=3363946 RepID=UPI00381EB56C